MAQIGTAISDLVLAASALYVAYHILASHLIARIGFLIIGIAASCGTVRYALNNPPRNVIHYHDLFTWLSSMIGLPFISAMYMYLFDLPLVGFGLTICATLLVILWRPLPSDIKQRTPEIVSAFSLLAIITVCIKHYNLHGIVGAVAYIASATMVGTRGTISGWRCVDIFHYGIAFGNLGLFSGLYRGYPPT